jgi:predicted permease
VARVLAALLDDAQAEAIAGDLDEERRRRSGMRGALWYWRAALGILVYVLSQRGRSIVRHAMTSDGGWHSNLGGELRRSARSLRRAPWYALTVVAVMALSMALAVTVFALVDGVLFKPLPFPDADRLVAIRGGFSDPSVRGNRSAKPVELDAWERAMPDVQFAAFADSRGIGLEAPNDPELGVAFIRRGFFETIGIGPHIGGFADADYALAGGPIPILLSHAFWQRRFGGNTAVVGDEIASDPRIGMFRIAGVLPAEFVIPFHEDVDLVLPLFGRMASPTQNSLNVVARLPDGMAIEVFQSRIDTLFQQLAAAESPPPTLSKFLRHPDRAIVVPLHERMTAPIAPLFGALFASAIVLALIACLNVSGLMAARTLDRRRELALRRAIGARGADLGRAIVLEHGLLFAAGALLALVAAGPLLAVTLSLLPDRMHLLKSPDIDGRTMLFALVAAGSMLAVASVWPIARALTIDAGQLTATGAALATPRTRSAGRFGVVAVQVAGALVLVVGGALLVGSLARVWQNAPGFHLDDLAIVEIAVPVDTRGGGDEAQIAARASEFARRIRELPGVVAAGLADGRVLDQSLQYSGVAFTNPDGTRVRDTGLIPVPVSGGFFTASGLGVRQGRVPTDGELDAGARVAVIGQRLADRLWPGRPAVGQSLRAVNALKTGRIAPEGLYSIVGVVDDARYVAWDHEPSSALYVPYASFHFTSAPSLFVRTAGPPAPVLRDVLAVAAGMAPRLRVVRGMTAREMLADTIRDRRLRSWLFGSFAAASLALVAVGMLGLVAMSVARRTREVGIRMALGATARTVLRGLVREQLRPVVAGIVLGGLGAAWAVGFLRAYLYEITVYEPRVWGVAVAVVIATALAGVMVPAWRASHVDPVRALRTE